MADTIDIPETHATLAEKLAYLDGLQDGQRTEHNDIGQVLPVETFDRDYRPRHTATRDAIALTKSRVRSKADPKELADYDAAHGLDGRDPRAGAGV